MSLASYHCSTPRLLGTAPEVVSIRSGSSSTSIAARPREPRAKGNFAATPVISAASDENSSKRGVTFSRGGGAARRACHLKGRWQAGVRPQLVLPENVTASYRAACHSATRAAGTPTLRKSQARENVTA